jgi:hypothetical protein
MLLVFCSVINIQSAHGEPSFTVARVYFENRAYNPQFFTFPLGSPFYNGIDKLAVYAAARVTETPDNPVLLNSNSSLPPVTDYVLTYDGNGLSKAVFFDDYIHPVYGGPFYPPLMWENQTYTFTVDTATSEWEIPDGSMVHMQVPQNVTVAGFYDTPTVSWDPVPGADYYRIIISYIDAGGLPIYTPLYTSPPITAVETFTVSTGGAANGTPYAVWVVAFKNHPIIAPRYENEFLNRSSYFTRYESDNCPFGGSDVDDGDTDGIVDCLDQCPGEDDSIDVDPANGVPDCLDAYTDLDSDFIRKGIDNCPDTPNPEQIDTNGDGLGDACDPIVASFNRAWLISDNRRFDPDHFQYTQGPFANGQEYWLMFASAEIDYDAPTEFPYPVTVVPITPSDSGIPVAYELQDWGDYLNDDHLHVGLFMDYANPVWGGPFYSPGAAWDDTVYTFQVRDVLYEWEIPGGSLQQLAIPEVTTTPGYSPTFTWLEVPGADHYRIMIYPLDQNGNIVAQDLLFVSETIPGTTDTIKYTYTGDMFKDGQEYGIWIQAMQTHPTAACKDDPVPCIINRSGLFIKHSYDISSVPCDVNGDRAVDITDSVTGLQVLSGLPAAGLSLPAGEALGFQEILCALQIQAGVREVETNLVDWDYDGYNAFSGDCNEENPGQNPGEPEICGDDIDNNCDGQTDEDCSETTPTPAGSDVSVSALGFDFVFETVTAGGATTVEVLPSVPGPPAGFLFAGTYHDVSTTAQFTGSVEVCINYDDSGLGPEEEAGLQIFHYNTGGGQWENITNSPADTENKRVCGVTTSLSPFALGFGSILGKWRVTFVYNCTGPSWVVTWEFHDGNIAPDPGYFHNFKQVGDQTDYGNWAWNSAGSTYTITLVTGFQIPGNISGNTISGSYTGGGGIPMCYSGVRQ